MSDFVGSAPRTPRLGVAFVPSRPPERLRDVAVAADDGGLDELWVWEDCFFESGIATAAAALAWTERIHVGLGLMPAPLRNVALTAMEIATVDRMFPGRFVPGVGHGVQGWMGQAGARVASPMTLLREYATALRRLLSGERVSVQGRYIQLDEVQLAWPPVSPPVLTMGGFGPKTLELSVELGDGILLAASLSEDEVRWACDVVREALRRQVSPDSSESVNSEHVTGESGVRESGSGAPGAGTLESGQPRFGHSGELLPEIVATQIVATGPGAQKRVDEEASRWGKESGQGIGVAGDAETIAGSVRRLTDLGITSVCFQPTLDEPDLKGFIRFLGQEVRPRLTPASG